MPHRRHSRLAFVSALALTITTSVNGVWEAGCHEHDAPAASDAWYPIDRNVEADGSTGRATPGNVSEPHEHACAACRRGCSKSAEARRNSATTPLELVSAAARPEDGGRARRGASRLTTARGPPPG